MAKGDARELREIARELEAAGMRCNCDLDNWEPETSGHSCVCRIHKRACLMKFRPFDLRGGKGAQEVNVTKDKLRQAARPPGKVY